MGMLLSVPQINQKGKSPGGIYEWTPSVLAALSGQNDVIIATEELSDFVDIGCGEAFITSLEVFALDDVVPELDIFFLDSNVALETEDAAISITDANAKKILTVINVPTSKWKDLIGLRYASLSTSDFGLKKVKAVAGSTSIYGAAVDRTGSITYTASGIFMRIGISYS